MTLLSLVAARYSESNAENFSKLTATMLAWSSLPVGKQEVNEKLILFQLVQFAISSRRQSSRKMMLMRCEICVHYLGGI